MIILFNFMCDENESLIFKPSERIIVYQNQEDLIRTIPRSEFRVNDQ